MNTYKPLKALARHPVLRREIRTLAISREALDFPLYRRTLIVGLVSLHGLVVVVALGAVLTRAFSSSPTSINPNLVMLPIVAIIAHIGLSLVADVTAIIRTVSWWHATLRREQLDILRTTLPDDREVVRIFTTLTLIRSWRPVQVDVAIRVVVTLACIAAAYYYGMLALFEGTWLQFSLYASVAVCASIGGLMYARNPARRIQTTVIFSTWIALRIKDSIAAILLTLAGCLALRMIIGAVFTVAIYRSILLLTAPSMRTIFDPANGSLLVSYVGWFGGLALVLFVGSRYFYATLNAVFEKRVIATLRSGA